MAIAMTDQQKEELNDKGFFIVENVLSADRVETISRAIDEVVDRVRSERNLPVGPSFGLRNGIMFHDASLDLIDQPDILALVVDAYGWNIHNRDSVLTVALPQEETADPGLMSLGWHFDYEEEFAGCTVDGTMPLLDFKVGWYISDHTEPGHSVIQVVPGSYKWGPEQRATWEEWLDPDEIVDIAVPAGSAMLWRPTLMHGVTANLSKSARKAIYVSYTPRWVRPSGHIEQDPELIARSSPVRRQLLGGLGDLSDPLGKDPANSPSSQYWFTDDWNSVPLKAWAEERAGSEDCEWGTGLGVSHTKGPGFEFTQRRMPQARHERGK
jgi:ectoine hydroxylase-related dioxygenase (phytanoyl-CoA dioxygenase family)